MRYFFCFRFLGLDAWFGLSCVVFVGYFLLGVDFSSGVCTRGDACGL